MTIPLSLLVAHFVGDFLFQTDAMATQKSKRWWMLYIHCASYTAAFVPVSLWLLDWTSAYLFLVITFLLHFATDAVTSRITARLWFVAGVERVHGRLSVRFNHKRHWFFVAIGWDQLLHYVMLAWTLELFR